MLPLKWMSLLQRLEPSELSTQSFSEATTHSLSKRSEWILFLETVSRVFFIPGVLEGREAHDKAVGFLLWQLWVKRQLNARHQTFLPVPFLLREATPGVSTFRNSKRYHFSKSEMSTDDTLSCLHREGKQLDREEQSRVIYTWLFPRHTSQDDDIIIPPETWVYSQTWPWPDNT